MAHGASRHNTNYLLNWLQINDNGGRDYIDSKIKIHVQIQSAGRLHNWSTNARDDGHDSSNGSRFPFSTLYVDSLVFPRSARCGGCPILPRLPLGRSSHLPCPRRAPPLQVRADVECQNDQRRRWQNRDADGANRLGGTPTVGPLEWLDRRRHLPYVDSDRCERRRNDMECAPRVCMLAYGRLGSAYVVV